MFERPGRFAILSIKHDSTQETDRWIGPAPWIETTPPGPLATAAIDRDNRVAASCYARCYPLVVRRANGSVVEDVDGNRYLDFAIGADACCAGHTHPKVVEAITRQVHDLIHISGSAFHHAPMIALSERLAAIAPGKSAKRVFLTNSGTEAIEAAIKLARWQTRRQWIIAFRGAFHGWTMGALALTSSECRLQEGFGPLLPMVAHVPYGDLDAIRTQLFGQQMAPEEVAAIFVQPLLSESRFAFPPDGFLPALRKLCDKHGILLVMDETHSGMGRTGKMFACQHFGVVPDILAVSKGIANGLPLGAIIAPEKVMTWPPSTHGSTCGGNPVACAAGLATLELLESSLLPAGVKFGELLLERLNRLTRRRRCLANARGLGLLAAVDVVNRQSGRPYPALRDRILHEAFQHGLLLLGCAEATIRLSPPLIVNQAQLEVGLDVLDEAISTVTD
ncbi:MAG: aminotransferase class III-fold pyridoxal phosphate-dependent enzyme [Phycisphaerae bacterium]|nr:aminotransferase class III-fold pyridoxal phosphate-dependent enzyme [Phycisphaerae bacterium]